MPDFDQFLEQLGDKIASKLADLTPPAKPADAPRLTTIGLAKAINAHPQTVRNWVRRGCPCLMVGRSPRFLLAEVEAWLAGQQSGKGAA